MKRIVLGVELKKDLDKLFETALLLANRYQAELVPIHIVEHIPVFQSHTQEKMLHDLIESQFDEVIKDLQLQDGTVTLCEAAIMKGQAHKHLTNYSENLHADLTMIGSGNREDGTLGHTAKRIARETHCPLWISHHDMDMEDLSRIICAVDFSDHSIATLNVAMNIARKLNSELTILHVVPEVTFYPGLADEGIYVSPWGATMYDLNLDEDELVARNKMTERIDKEEFAKFLEDFNLDGIRYKTETLHGVVDEKIIEATIQARAGLLVMGLQGTSSFLGSLLGGTVEKVLHQLPCSLVTVPKNI